MKAIILTEDKKSDWNDYVFKNPYSIAWHVYEWSYILRNHYNTVFYPITAFDGPRIRGILPLYHLRTTFSKDLLISIPYVVAGGIVADGKESKVALLNKAIDLSKQYNGCNIIYKQYKIRNQADLQTDNNFYNRELNLSKPLGMIWQEISETNREKVEMAKKQNPSLDYPSQNLDIF